MSSWMAWARKPSDRRCLAAVSDQLGDHDHRAFAAESAGDRLPDALTGAGDDGDAVLKLQFVSGGAFRHDRERLLLEAGGQHWLSL